MCVSLILTEQKMEGGDPAHKWTIEREKDADDSVRQEYLVENFISHSDLERKEFHFVRRRTICPQTFAACFHPFQDGRKCGHTLRNYPSNQNLGQQLKSQNSDFHEIMIFEQQ